METEIIIREHPTLSGILVRSDGAIFIPYVNCHPEHWTYGSKNIKGYRFIGYNYQRFSVHRLVAETFIPNPENKPEVDHIDRNPNNNSVSNLRWVTVQENNNNRKDNLPEITRPKNFQTEREWRKFYMRNYRIKNKDKQKEYNKNYYQENKEQINKRTLDNYYKKKPK